MKTELEILRDVSARLDAAGIEFMVTGSVAMNYYAQPRMTRDIDVVMLILSKLYWARDSRSELQLRNVRNLLHRDCNLDYLRSRAKTLGVEQLLEEMLAER